MRIAIAVAVLLGLAFVEAWRVREAYLRELRQRVWGRMLRDFERAMTEAGRILVPAMQAFAVSADEAGRAIGSLAAAFLAGMPPPPEDV